MKASEIIDRLTEIIKVNGDLEVSMTVDTFGSMDNATDDHVTDEVSEICVESIEGTDREIKWIEFK